MTWHSARDFIGASLALATYLPAAPALAAIACATLFNMLRAADWGFNTGAKQQRGARR
jgi:hypothetical protein